MPVPRGARVLGVLATLSGLPFVVWWYAIGAYQGGLLVVMTLLTLAPQVARRARDFRVACWTVAGLLLVASLLGALLGWFLMAPAALVLVAAGARSGARAGWVAQLAGGAVAFMVYAGMGTALYRSVVEPYFQEPDAFVAVTDSGALPAVVAQEEQSARTGRPALGHGATDLWVSSTGGVPGGRLTVRFVPGTPQAELDALRARIAELPGVHDVKLCSPPDGNCR
ncbi:hypothetical protein ACGFX4_10190 [Kitasatospora sp. NPDC048365]|uniref:hypothetical protein n=1 Tax=Kitasatospora sp. NPDC048365 TaxID=3364050 RepID=UPI003722A58B